MVTDTLKPPHDYLQWRGSYLREELLLSNRLSKAQQQTALLIVLSNSNLSFSNRV
ncbi:MAG: hypothetical protein F6K50_05350 [Moorea sp. SIO3I7]|uniref:hypothetical protein n=1 Tax=unclassified Moorena TaxID=2683338 RepID=UPI0013BFD6E4|nr:MULTISPECIES: hypothetical protein [unclassified Moorena]NEN94972.1 hypothetical protein [Moorena sp. SIO3I7]NEO09429.1 hypothetical protein [Moorena sp. SIO3I8]NEO23428.1 hypothetical protein [Moorena sp. SIO4A5]